jgi:GNAT superfamily N-acetyltransferase
MPAMIVHPDYQRRGIGTKLLAEVCSLADKVGQDIYLESSPRGTKLYLNAGFDRIGDIEMLDGAYVIVCMLRKAGAAVS